MDENRSRGSPRLQFSKEELENDALKRPIQKAEKAADKYEAAQKKLKRYRVRLTLENKETDAASSVASQEDVSGDAHSAPHAGENTEIQSDPSAPAVQNTRQKPKPEKAGAAKASASGNKPGAVQSSSAGSEALHSDTAATGAKKKAFRLKFEETQKKKPSQLTHPVQKAVRTAGDQLHRQAKNANEDDNVAVDAVLQADQKAESALQMGEHAYHAHKMRPYKHLEKAEKRLDQANIRVMEKQYRQEHPQFTSNPYSRWQQKRAIRREYAAAKRGKGGRTVQNTAKNAEKATEKVSDAAGKAVEVIRRHPTILLILALGGMLLIVMSSLQACTPLAQSVLESVVIGTYPAEEEDVRAAERVYAEKERQLKDEMDHYERYHPGYDEYHVEADEIWHNPYVLIAIISAYYDGQEWDIDSAMPVIEKYFALQYVVTETVTTETRYRTERQTGTRLVTDPDTGRTYTSACIIPRVIQKEMHPLDAPEQVQLLQSLKGKKNEALIVTALFTGMRAGELLGLTWDNVDFDHGVIHIVKQLTQSRGEGHPFAFGTLKNGKTRSINPAPFVLETLKAHKEYQEEQKRIAGDLWNEGKFPNLVFTHADGSHLSQPTIWKAFQKALEDAGLDHHRLHDCRHTFAVNSIRAGDDIKTIQENMGHYSAAFTLDRYGHVTETMRQESANRMQAFIQGISGNGGGNA